MSKKETEYPFNLVDNANEDIQKYGKEIQIVQNVDDGYYSVDILTIDDGGNTKGPTSGNESGLKSNGKRQGMFLTPIRSTQKYATPFRTTRKSEKAAPRKCTWPWPTYMTGWKETSSTNKERRYRWIFNN